MIVPGNRWDLLAPPADAVWTPSRAVSICVPVRDPGTRFVQAINWLAEQSYPAELIEVVVADDSSTQPISATQFDVPFPVRVVRQDLDRFAAGRARNLAASAASGEVLVFLDADLFAAPDVVAAYLRWFDRSGAVVPMGHCRFIGSESLGGGDVSDIRRLFETPPPAADDVDDQDWRLPKLLLTDQLRNESVDSFRVVVGASLAIGAEQFDEVGGFCDAGVRGVEDIELGYRLQNNGAVLIPEPNALHFHVGERTMSGSRAAALREERRPFVSRLLPVGGFREPPGAGPVNERAVELEPVAKVLVVVDPTNEGDDAARSAAQRIAAIGGWDVEARVGQAVSLSFERAFCQMVVSPGVAWNDLTAELIVDAFERRGVGWLVAVDTQTGSTIDIVRTRAVRRCSTSGTPLADARHLFGIAVVDADEVGLRPQSDWKRRSRVQRRRLRTLVARVRRRFGRLASRTRSRRTHLPLRRPIGPSRSDRGEP